MFIHLLVPLKPNFGKIIMDKQEPIFVDQEYLARRWGVSEATLERDRSLKQGVQYLKIGGLIRYRLQDVLDYENDCVIKTSARKQR